ncbi:hypothetical protein ECPA48_3158 [Escherichia coli PA48]|nr:hypothetical protein ECPA48_3158 [Escherichia coli PA48]
MWFTYLFSRVGSFICINLMKRRSQKFENELRNLIESVKRYNLKIKKDSVV